MQQALVSRDGAYTCIQEGKADLDYCVARLVKGLASDRKGARHGYFITLCEVSTL